MFDYKTQISEIVKSNFQTARIFDYFGLDYYCNGRKTLQESCKDKGIHTSLILSELSTLTDFYKYGESTADNVISGRWNPGFADKLTAIMINTFIKFNGLELFGTYERPEGGDFRGAAETRAWNQFAFDAIYRFGMDENFYAGVRYNTAKGKLANINPNEVTINRVQAGLGWFLTKNILAKLEYVNQTYNDFPVNNIYSKGKFSGYIIEAVISF